MEPEALVQCPYDKSHQIRAARLPYHLVKCQRNNQRAARALATCPFNARHRVPTAELQSHITSCPDRAIDVTFGNRLKPPEMPASGTCLPCNEDWEAELEDLEDPPPFILSSEPRELLVPCHSSAPAAPTTGYPTVGAQPGPTGPPRGQFLPPKRAHGSARGGSAPGGGCAYYGL